MTRTIFLLQFALAFTLTAMAWRLVRTPKAPLESERFASTRLAWVDRSGAVLDSIELKGRYILPRLSPEGSKLLLTQVEPGKADVWSFSMASHAISRLTGAKSRSAFAVWAHDRDLYFFGLKDRIMQKAAASESEKLIFRDTPDVTWRPVSILPEDSSADGRWLVFTEKHGTRPNQVYLLRTGTRVPFLLLKTKAEVSEARFSRDGNWIALTSSFNGRNEVYVAPIPPDPARLPLAEQNLIRVSEYGGYSPEWGPNRELLYISSKGDLMTAAWNGTAPRPTRSLFRIRSVGLPEYEYRFGGYCVAGDGGRFLIALSTAAKNQPATDLRKIP